MTEKHKFWSRTLLAATLALSFNVCYADNGDEQNVSSTARQIIAAPENSDDARMIYVSKGLRLSVPREYDKLVVVDTLQENGRLFSVSEKASIAADKAQGGSGEGAGWLFGIGVISEIQLQKMLQEDMSGVEIFARDNEGLYYVYYRPTDVRLVRDNYDRPELFQDWTMLNEWAYNEARAQFIADNPGLISETYGNAALDMNLARVAFADDAQYTVGTSTGNTLYSPDINPAPYALRLMRNATSEALNDTATPTGDYIRLQFPQGSVRFDFFLTEDSENIYRQTWVGGRDQLFRLKFADGSTKAAKIMQEWYEALAMREDRKLLGYSADSLLGKWAEKTVGQGVITITPGAKGTYDVMITWRDGAATQHIWDISAARPNGETGVLHYDHCHYLIRNYHNAKDFDEETVYKNGTGKFYLNSASELMWQDNVDGVGNNTVFVKVDD
ncbi:MAG: hypothetical protein IJ849_08735 [Selenomonadaceae bacterium]|nr:hypothetical protein [Selenomonadaceae bacterium]